MAGLQPRAEFVQNFDDQPFVDWHCFSFQVYRGDQLIVERAKTTKFKHTYRSIFALIQVNSFHDIRVVELAQNLSLEECQVAMAGPLVEFCYERLVLVVAQAAKN